MGGAEGREERDFGVLDAFGIKPNPGTALQYTDITDTIYACDEECEYYNQIIDADYRCKVLHTHGTDPVQCPKAP